MYYIIFKKPSEPSAILLRHNLAKLFDYFEITLYRIKPAKKKKKVDQVSEKTYQIEDQITNGKDNDWI